MPAPAVLVSVAVFALWLFLVLHLALDVLFLLLRRLLLQLLYILFQL